MLIRQHRTNLRSAFSQLSPCGLSYSTRRRLARRTYSVVYQFLFFSWLLSFLTVHWFSVLMCGRSPWGPPTFSWSDFGQPLKSRSKHMVREGKTPDKFFFAHTWYVSWCHAIFRLVRIFSCVLSLVKNWKPEWRDGKPQTSVSSLMPTWQYVRYPCLANYRPTHSTRQHSRTQSCFSVPGKIKNYIPVNLILNWYSNKMRVECLELVSCWILQQ